MTILNRLQRLNERVTAFERGDHLKGALTKAMPWPPLTHVAVPPRGGEAAPLMARQLSKLNRTGSKDAAKALLGATRDEFASQNATLGERIAAFVRSGRK